MTALKCLYGLALVTVIAHADAPKSSTDLFQLGRVWNASFTLDADQWKLLQPKMPEGGGFPFGGRGGGPGGGNRPGGPGGGPGGPGGPGGERPAFGPGNFFAGMVLSTLDTDKDNSLNREEFTQGFEKWFKEWDSKRTGSVTSDEMRDGFTKSLTSPPPGGGRGPGGPGGPGFGLQASEGQRNGLSGMQGIHFEYAKATFEFEGEKFREVAVRYKGNGTFMDARNSDKKSLKVDINEFTKNQKIAGLGKLNFHNNITDVAWMHEPLAYDLYRAAGVPAPRTTYSKVLLNASGAYTNHVLGLYSIVENLDNQWAEHNFQSKKGAIFKPVTRELFKFQGTDWSAYNQAYDPKTDLSAKQKQRVFDFSKLVTDADDTEFAKRLPEFLDIDEFSRFMAVTVWLSSTDSILMMGQNFVVYLHPKTDKFLFIPWDLDRAFGNFFTPSPERMSIHKAWAEDNRFLERVMKVPAVKDAYLARLQEFQKTLFQPERFAKLVDATAKVIRPIVAQEGPAKLEKFDDAVAGKSESSSNEGPGGFRGFGRPAKPIKAFTKERYQAVADQLAGKDEGEPLAGGFGPGGGGGGPGRGGRGGPGGGMRFGPGNMIAPPVFKAADQDNDSKVTLAEFKKLGERWFAEWDKKKAGKLTQEDLVAGLNAVIPPPNFGPPPGQ